MSDATLWWMVTGLLVVAELLTGTFYLLMLAVGVACGALAAHAHYSLNVQLIVAAVVGIGAALAWHTVRLRRAAHEPAADANRNVNLDIGETVHVEVWGPERTAQVQYRGASWTAVPAVQTIEPPQNGAHRIVAMRGSQLVLEPVAH